MNGEILQGEGLRFWLLTGGPGFLFLRGCRPGGECRFGDLPEGMSGKVTLVRPWFLRQIQVLMEIGPIVWIPLWSVLKKLVWGRRLPWFCALCLRLYVEGSRNGTNSCSKGVQHFWSFEMLGIKHSVISLLKSHRDHGHNGSVIRHTITILPKTMARRVCFSLFILSDLIGRYELQPGKDRSETAVQDATGLGTHRNDVLLNRIWAGIPNTWNTVKTEKHSFSGAGENNILLPGESWRRDGWRRWGPRNLKAVNCRVSSWVVWCILNILWLCPKIRAPQNLVTYHHYPERWQCLGIQHGIPISGQTHMMAWWPKYDRV